MRDRRRRYIEKVFKKMKIRIMDYSIVMKIKIRNQGTKECLEQPKVGRVKEGFSLRGYGIPLGTLISDSGPPEMQENQFLLF